MAASGRSPWDWGCFSSPVFFRLGREWHQILGLHRREIEAVAIDHELKKAMEFERAFAMICGKKTEMKRSPPLNVESVVR